MADPILSLTNASFTWPRAAQPLLRDINLHLIPGERLGLFGANGAGKSTLLWLIMGLIPWQNGQLQVAGLEITTAHHWRRLRQHIGLLMQHPEDQLFCPSVREDCRFGPLNHGCSPAQADLLADRALEALGIRHLADCPPWQLSGGSCQLAALAAVLACQPQVILLDEPSNGLDPEAMERLYRVLRQDHLALLVVSHDHQFLGRSCDRHVHLVDGCLR